MVITQNLNEVAFDMRSYPAHLYSTHFKRADDLVERLREIGTKHLQGLLEFGNPVTDFLPKLKARANRDIKVTDPVALAAAFGNAGADTPQDLLTRAGDALDAITSIFGHLSSDLAAFTATLKITTPQIAGTEADWNFDVAREAIKRARSEIAAYAGNVRMHIAPFHSAWEQLGSAMFRLMTSSDQRRRLRDAPTVLSGINELSTKVTSALETIIVFRNTMSRIRMASLDLRDAVSEAEMSLDSLINELVLAKAYAARIDELITTLP